MQCNEIATACSVEFETNQMSVQPFKISLSQNEIVPILQGKIYQNRMGQSIKTMGSVHNMPLIPLKSGALYRGKFKA